MNRKSGSIDENVDYEEAEGFDPATGSPIDIGSNWLVEPMIDPEELGEDAKMLKDKLGPEDREDNGQSGPTQENGGIGLGDEEGLGRTSLSEAGLIGSHEHDTKNAG